MTRYRLLAVDVDGTLVGPDQCVSDPHTLALRRAKHEGLAVCLCTGRSYAETRGAWSACRLEGSADPMVCVGGSLVAESDTGRTLHIEPIDRDVALKAAELMGEMGYSVVALVDRWRWNFDYYLTAGGDGEAIWRDWFGKHDCVVRQLRRLDDEPKLPEILRLTALVQADRTADLEQALRDRFADRLESYRIFAPNYGIHVVECFGQGVNKWSGVRYVAQGLRVAARDIVAIGDDINDLPMIQRAGLGVAMGNAPQWLREAADHVADRHDRHGLATFVDGLLAGQFD